MSHLSMRCGELAHTVGDGAGGVVAHTVVVERVVANPGKTSSRKVGGDGGLAHHPFLHPLPHHPRSCLEPSGSGGGSGPSCPAQELVRVVVA